MYNYAYKGKTSKRVNLYIQDEVLWEHFAQLVERGNVSTWIENYIRPFVNNSDLASSYQMMAQDKSRFGDFIGSLNSTELENITKVIKLQLDL